MAIHEFITRRVLTRAVVAASLLPVLPGCRDEAAERQAFIRFLQTRIVDRSGIHIPIMNAETAQSFGDYAKDYRIILTANDSLDLPILPRFAALKGRLHGIADLVAHRDDLIELHKAVPGIIASNRKGLDTANAARADLHQPPDLRAVYDRAFDRIVTGPATMLSEMLPILDTNLAAMIALADYIKAHTDEVVINGTSAASLDPKIDAELTELFAALHRQDAKIDQIKKRFLAMVAGSQGH